VQGSISGPPDLLETNRADVTLAYDYLLSDLLSLAVSYDFSRETWAAVPTDTHRISFDVTLAPLDTSQVTLGVVFEHRPFFLEWSVDVQLLIGIELL